MCGFFIGIKFFEKLFIFLNGFVFFNRIIGEVI